MNTLSRQYFIGICFVILLSFISLIYLINKTSQQNLQPPPKISGTILIDPYPLSPFALVDQDNRIFNNSNLTGDWHLVSYGYLQCPDVCPTSLLLLTRIKEQLFDSSYMLNVVFYTVDPVRDRPKNLKKYLRYFDDEFIGLTHQNIPPNEHDFAKSLGIKAKIETTQVENNQQIKVSHGVHLFLINPAGKLVAVFKPQPHSIGIDEPLPSFNPKRLYKDITTTIDYLNVRTNS
ncbi:SCO family protein [Thalassotalea nanhaiensis]|uniref:SCO family protein n=1 Tax=Thalassotalea nanhaiensis TaxID=3065648 RepID=A0ABY9TDA6_9GAMM|nr:SCO family protein [Colwelliaceae bacterium SQ345]